MADCKGIETHFSTFEKLRRNEGARFHDPTLYRSVIGSLQYAVLTRPELAFSVNKLSQYMSDPRQPHWIACKRILRYLKSTMNMCLRFRKSEYFDITAYTDADWASDPDDRSELKLKVEGVPVILSDSTSAAAIAANPVYHSKTKHFEIDLHFIRDKVMKGEIEISYVASKDQTADVLTKPLPHYKLSHFRSKLNVIDKTLCLREGVEISDYEKPTADSNDKLACHLSCSQLQSENVEDEMDLLRWQNGYAEDSHTNIEPRIFVWLKETKDGDDVEAFSLCIACQFCFNNFCSCPRWSISLDCGSPKDSNYTDSLTGLNYTSDSAFIGTGISKSISPEFKTEDLNQQLWNVRSFPEGKRNCYNVKLPRAKNNKYLIRARFMYGNCDARNVTPQFDLHLQANFWVSVKLENADSIISEEIIHVPSSDYLQTCLVNTGLGTPFISALEIRSLNNTIYKTKSGSLYLFSRLDIASTTKQMVRYQDDAYYDRIWMPFNLENWGKISTSLTIDDGFYIDLRPPEVVMRTAATPANASEPLEFYLITDDTLEFNFYFYFAELTKLQPNESREFNISFNGKHIYGPLSPEYLYSLAIFSVLPTMSGGDNRFSIYKTKDSTLPPILNAIEIYTVKQFLQHHTDEQDGVKLVLKDTSLVSDLPPLLPLSLPFSPPMNFRCTAHNKPVSYDGFDPSRIMSLNLSASGLTGEIAPYFSNLPLLQYLDLSNNSLTGPVPNFLAKLPALRILNLEGNMLTGLVPIELIERSKKGSLSLRCVSYLIVNKFSCCLNLIMMMHSFGKVDTYDSLELENRRFSHSQILRLTNNFEKVLGKGGSGTVYQGYFDTTPVAIKMLY
ncbi:putative leucine-rich repeat receptor-like protein kinase [Citrus sinensis]|uniref:Leucine-rich repeat receptor-like protein kinase n=1 Tax=Citrus sinensis TaxID=2711 RepID=A0ACB8JAR0_CITSI|nr:putative leucine-rich repeat receptor-like protein kinase [Citrus sinensis]